MENFMEKLSSYNILNNILPGVVVIYIFEFIYQLKVLGNDLIENLLIEYNNVCN